MRNGTLGDNLNGVQNIDSIANDRPTRRNIHNSFAGNSSGQESAMENGMLMFLRCEFLSSFLSHICSYFHVNFLQFKIPFGWRLIQCVTIVWNQF